MAERVRNHRQKVKENAEKHEAHKEKDKLRKRESRKKSVDPKPNLKERSAGKECDCTGLRKSCLPHMYKILVTLM